MWSSVLGPMSSQQDSDRDDSAAGEDKRHDRTPAGKKRSSPKGGHSRARRSDAARNRPDEARPAPASASGSKLWRTWVPGVAALAVGLVAGWFLRGAFPGDAAAGGSQVPGMGPDPGTAPPSGSGAAGANPLCDSWVKGLCDGAGATSEACTLAEAAAELLPAAACREATAALPATLARVQQARSACSELVTKLCADLGEGTDSCTMVREKTPSMPTSQCQQMLGQYDRVLAELKQMEAANAPLSDEAAAAQRAGSGPAFGPADAKVAIVEYSDFECPFCSRAAETVHALKERYGDRVRFVFRQFPLPMHENASLAAEASLAAHAQGKFWPYHDLLFANQRQLDRASLEGYAKEAGLDLVKFNKALDEHTYAEAVKADVKLGEQIGVSGTPTMIVGTKRVDNPTEISAVAPLVEAELAAAGATAQ